jgi:tRNA(Ile)-lysidine synthase
MRPLVPWEAWATAPDDSSPRPPLIRPLLDTPRHEIEAYCTDHQLAPRIDPTNTSPAYTRSHIRTELLPALAAYNPQIVAALTRTAQVCADDYTFLQDHLDTLWPELAAARPGAIFLRAEQWEQLPTALQRYALRRAARQLIGSDDLGYEQIEAGRAAATRGTGTQQTLARGLLLRVEHDGLLLLYEPDYDPASAAVSSVTEVPQLGSSEIPLAVPGTTPVSEFWEAQAGSGQPPAGHDTIGKCWQVRLAAERLDGPLLLRRRRPGDRFRPAGGRGSRRLQDVFTDYKIRRELRAAWPVLATPTAIVWVAGLRADDRFQADETTQRVIWVMLRRRAACRQTSSEY